MVTLYTLGDVASKRLLSYKNFKVRAINISTGLKSAATATMVPMPLVIIFNAA